jgi:hypothetical protein
VDNTEGPVRTTKAFAHSRTTIPGAKQPLDIADVVEFCRASKLPGKVTITLPGNGGVTSVVFEGKEEVVAVEEEKVDNPDQ